MDEAREIRRRFLVQVDEHGEPAIDHRVASAHECGVVRRPPVRGVDSGGTAQV